MNSDPYSVFNIKEKVALVVGANQHTLVVRVVLYLVNANAINKEQKETEKPANKCLS